MEKQKEKSYKLLILYEINGIVYFVNVVYILYTKNARR